MNKNAWQYTPNPNGLEGEYIEERVDWFGHDYDTSKIITKSKARLYATEEVTETVTDETGDEVTVTNNVPLPVSEAYFTFGMDAPRAATEAELQARADAAAQAEADRIATLAQTHGAKVGMLANLLTVYGMQIPTSKAEVVAKIEQLVATGTVTPEQTATIGTIEAVYNIIEQSGIMPDVGAIWEAMQP